VILKKPYAFFIKLFKPIHLILSGLVLYLIILTNNILVFLRDYMYKTEVLADKEVIVSLVDNFLYIIPVIAMIVFLLIIGIMYKKNKPFIFYFVGFFLFLVVIVINAYSLSFLNILLESVVSIKSIKLIHDLVLINIIIESVIFFLLIIRGFGIDFRKFDFTNDISKFEINESDREEFEVNVNIDFNERKRKRKEKIRYLSYTYAENSFLINIGAIIMFIVIVLLFFYTFYIKSQKNREGNYYSAGSFEFKVNKAILLNTDYKGNKINDNYLIIVDTDIKSNYANNKLYLNDFSLDIDQIQFKPVKKYFDRLIDLGNFYEEQILPFEYTNYLFVFEIPEKYIKSEMYFSYNNKGEVVEVFIEPKKLESVELSETKKTNETLILKEPLNGIEFKVNDYSLDKKFLIEYNYCINKNDCIFSKEYLKPSIDENYDKVILKLNIDYASKSELGVDSFYQFLSKFGVISYKIGDRWYSIYKFEEIASKRVSSKENVYIGVNSKIMDADSIKIIFNVRDLKYEYVLK